MCFTKIIFAREQKCINNHFGLAFEGEMVVTNTTFVLEKFLINVFPLKNFLNSFLKLKTKVEFKGLYKCKVWSSLKRGIFGIYHSTGPKHLNKYCDEFSCRYNTRSITDRKRFTLSLVNADEKLTYKQLIQK